MKNNFILTTQATFTHLFPRSIVPTAIGFVNFKQIFSYPSQWANNETQSASMDIVSSVFIIDVKNCWPFG